MIVRNLIWEEITQSHANQYAHESMRQYREELNCYIKF